MLFYVKQIKRLGLEINTTTINPTELQREMMQHTLNKETIIFIKNLNRLKIYVNQLENRNYVLNSFF